ncbi:MAG TPA: class I SAM-dependent methyltransferase [Bryobacteraceae bacterium]|nr:class I SAM-dependent methyltransferase [Bryobacteraceae bacterium]HPT25480.1 class I SAM-dependent methyltransferase [Bryobacteraceae bacterium]
MNPIPALASVAALMMASACFGQPPGGYGGRGMRGGYSSGGYGIATQAADAAEKRILDVAAGTERVMSVPEEDGRLIRLLTESIGAKTAVEIGSSTGYSGLWFALGLRKTGGKLTTFEYDKGRAATARENYRKAGVDSIITLVEGDAHVNVKQLKGPIDIVFIDADKEGYADYLAKILPLVRPGGLILAHNISSREQNPEYMNAVAANANLETIKVNSEMSVTLKKR